MPFFSINVQPDVEKTEVSYSGPEEDLRALRDRLDELDSSDVYPSFDGDHDQSLFFHTVEDEDVQRIRSVSSAVLSDHRSSGDPEGDSARSPLYPKVVAVLALLFTAGFLVYHFGIAREHVEHSPQVDQLKQEMARETSNRDDGATTPTDASEQTTQDSDRDQNRDGDRRKTSSGESNSQPNDDDSATSKTQQRGKAAAERFFARQEEQAQSFPAPLRVHFIDVGQGDAVLVELPEREYVLIDAGYARFGDRVVNYLEERGVERLKRVVMTHPHADHIGGMRDVLRSFEVGEVWDAGVSHSSQTYKKTLEAIDNQGISYRTPKRGRTESWGNYCRARILHPDETASSSHLNNASIVATMTCGGGRFLLTGDAEKDVERELASEVNFSSVDVLKAGHHGSKTSSTKAFLEQARPSIGIISSGRDNTYGHPSPEAMRRLSEFDVELYRTDQQGSVVVTYDGDSFRVQTERGNGPVSLSLGPGMGPVFSYLLPFESVV